MQDVGCNHKFRMTVTNVKQLYYIPLVCLHIIENETVTDIHRVTIGHTVLLKVEMIYLVLYV